MLGVKIPSFIDQIGSGLNHLSAAGRTRRPIRTCRYMKCTQLHTYMYAHTPYRKPKTIIAAKGSNRPNKDRSVQYYHYYCNTVELLLFLHPGSDTPVGYGGSTPIQHAHTHGSLGAMPTPSCNSQAGSRGNTTKITQKNSAGAYTSFTDANIFFSSSVVSLRREYFDVRTITRFPPPPLSFRWRTHN